MKKNKKPTDISGFLSEGRSRLTCHLSRVAKYRFKVLKGHIQNRCRDLLIQIFEAKGIENIKGSC